MAGAILANGVKADDLFLITIFYNPKHPEEVKE